MVVRGQTAAIVQVIQIRVAQAVVRADDVIDGCHGGSRLLGGVGVFLLLMLLVMMLICLLLLLLQMLELLLLLMMRIERGIAVVMVLLLLLMMLMLMLRLRRRLLLVFRMIGIVHGSGLIRWRRIACRDAVLDCRRTVQMRMVELLMLVVVGLSIVSGNRDRWRTGAARTGRH